MYKLVCPGPRKGLTFLSLFKHCLYSLEANAIQIFLIIFFSILRDLTYPLHSLLCFTVLRLNRKDEGFYKRKLWAREQETGVSILELQVFHGCLANSIHSLPCSCFSLTDLAASSLVTLVSYCRVSTDPCWFVSFLLSSSSCVHLSHRFPETCRYHFQ